jgi:hypothetical protein
LFFLSLISTYVFQLLKNPHSKRGFREIPHCGAGKPMSEPCQSALCSSVAEHLLSVCHSRPALQSRDATRRYILGLAGLKPSFTNQLLSSSIICLRRSSVETKFYLPAYTHEFYPAFAPLTWLQPHLHHQATYSQVLVHPMTVL